MRKTKRTWALRMVRGGYSAGRRLRAPLLAQNAGTPGAAQEAVAGARPAQAGQAKADVVVVKSYELKYIGASEFMRSAKFYVLDSTGTEKSLTVRIMASQIPAFEALLKKLDVEKKNIQFSVYTIAASQVEPSQIVKTMVGLPETKEIADRDLKKVLDEMKGLWKLQALLDRQPVLPSGQGRIGRQSIPAGRSIGATRSCHAGCPTERG